MFSYRTPGVYFEWQDTRTEIIDGARTDIAAFVGIAERGPLHQPVKISSWTQYMSTFGQHIPQGYLAFAVHGFFANGGQDCWVVRVADPDASSPAYLTVQDDKGNKLFSLQATSPGVWGRDVNLLFQRTNETHFNLFIKLPDGTQELWRDVSLCPFTDDVTTPCDDRDRKAAALLNTPEDHFYWASSQPGQRPKRDARVGSQIITVIDPEHYAPDTTAILTLPSEWELAIGTLQGGADGLATLTLQHLTGNGAPEDKTWGLATLVEISEVSIVAIPDSISVPPRKVPGPAFVDPRCDVDETDPFLDLRPQTFANALREFPPTLTQDQTYIVQLALITHCETLKDRVALIDPYGTQLDPAGIIGQRKQFDTEYAALYYPWIGVLDPDNILRFIPPCGHVAGMYAQVDRRVGVHKPPANEVLESVHELAFPVDDVTHGVLNDAYVNVIRAANARGIRVMGARTLSTDTLWRYVNVRRLIIMIEKAIDINTQWMVFETNSYPLWNDTIRVITDFLTRLWRRGMLDGISADDAFHVVCDETTNPPEERDNGRMICQIGVQPPWPAEFVVVRIGKTQGSTEILGETANG